GPRAAARGLRGFISLYSLDRVREFNAHHDRGGVARREQERADLRVCLTITAGAFDAEHEERRRKRVGPGGGRGGDGGTRHAPGRPAGARVEDVPQFLAVILQVL